MVRQTRAAICLAPFSPLSIETHALSENDPTKDTEYSNNLQRFMLFERMLQVLEILRRLEKGAYRLFYTFSYVFSSQFRFFSRLISRTFTLALTMNIFRY